MQIFIYNDDGSKALLACKSSNRTAPVAIKNDYYRQLLNNFKTPYDTDNFHFLSLTAYHKSSHDI